MTTAVFLLTLVSPLLSVPVERSPEQRIFSLFRPDCSRPVFAPLGLYNPCPDTTTTTTTTGGPTTSGPSTTTTTPCKGVFGFGLLNSLLGIPCEDETPTTTTTSSP